MEYYSAMRKKEILPFLTAWMGLEGIMLSEICQTEKDKHYMISLICGIVKKKKMNSQKQRVERWLPGAGGCGKWGEVGQRVQTSTYKMNKFWRSNVQYSDYR